MNEEQIRALMDSLDSDLLDRELDALMGSEGISVDTESIARRSRQKLANERRKTMKVKKIAATCAAALVICAGVTTVYASEISEFLKNFFGKSTAYSTMVDGDGYHLKSPVTLAGGETLNTALFTKEGLQIAIDMAWSDDIDLKIRAGGKEYTPDGFSKGPNGIELAFYEVPAAAEFELSIGGKTNTVKLQKGESISDDTAIVPAQGGVDWISLGGKRIEGGVQLVADVTKDGVSLTTFGAPRSIEYKGTTDNTDGRALSNGTSSGSGPLTGTDADGKSWEFAYNADETGRPLTRFYSKMPADKALTLKVPAVQVSIHDVLDTVPVALPENGQSASPAKEIDLGLQKIRLDTVSRTSATTAQLKFTLNTGSDSKVKIFSTSMDSEQILKSDLLLKGNEGVLNITFKEDIGELELFVGWPTFVVSGDWTLQLD